MDIFETIKHYMTGGKTFEEAVEAAEKILRVKLPENVIDLARQACNG